MSVKLLTRDYYINYEEILRCNFDLRSDIEQNIKTEVRKYIKDNSLTLENDIDVSWHSKIDKDGNKTGVECCTAEALVSFQDIE